MPNVTCERYGITIEPTGVWFDPVRVDNRSPLGDARPRAMATRSLRSAGIDFGVDCGCKRACIAAPIPVESPVPTRAATDMCRRRPPLPVQIIVKQGFALELCVAVALAHAVTPEG